MAEGQRPEILDYEGSNYRTDFWEGKGRDYEDRVDRIALRRLLPPTGSRLLDVGAGYGRYTDEFKGYGQVVLLDYSRSMLEFAAKQYGEKGFLYVAADAYNMPFAPGVFDTAVMLRVIHHMQDAPLAIKSVRRVTKNGGTFVLEFANKQNLKAMIRWALRQQDWNPYDHAPVEFIKLNYDFHPAFIRDALKAASFQTGRTLSVSHFRLELVKKLIPTGILVALDSLFQPTGALWQLTPQSFTRSQAVGEDEPAPEGAFWRCPKCGGYDLEDKGEHLLCKGCKTKWGKVNGVYDFKQPLK